jgi:two-component system, response regulator
MSKVTTLLLVEDSADDRELTVIGLRDAAISNPIEIARDGQEALEYLSEPTRPLPALVLLDLKLPRISGLDVLARLRERERTSLLPVVVLTSSNEESDRLRSYGAGANAYVCKPVEFGEFAQAIKALGLFWLIVNQPPPAIRATDAASSS